MTAKYNFHFQKFASAFFWLLVWILSTLLFVLCLFEAKKLNYFESLPPLLDGTAPRPYIYRILVPVLINGLSSYLHISADIGSLSIMYLSLLGFAVSFWHFSRLFLSEQGAQIATLIMPFALVPLFLVIRRIYDFTTLLLFTLCLLFLFRRQFLIYSILFIFACINKETSILLIPFFWLQFRNLPKRQFRMILGTQIASYTIVRLVLFWIFRNNPGGVAEFHLFDQIAIYESQPYLTVVYALLILLTAALAFYKPVQKPLFLRNAAFAIGAPLLILYFFFGRAFEIRVFLEAFPAVYLLIVIPFVGSDKELIRQD